MIACIGFLLPQTWIIEVRLIPCLLQGSYTREVSNGTKAHLTSPAVSLRPAWTSKSHYASSLLIKQNFEVPSVQRKRMLRVNAMATVSISCIHLSFSLSVLCSNSSILSYDCSIIHYMGEDIFFFMVSCQ